MEIWSEMFLASMDCLRGIARNSEVLDAVRNATPKSKAEFESKYGSIRMEHVIVGRSGDVTKILTLTEDGEALALSEDGEVLERGSYEIEDLSE